MEEHQRSRGSEDTDEEGTGYPEGGVLGRVLSDLDGGMASERNDVKDKSNSRQQGMKLPGGNSEEESEQATAEGGNDGDTTSPGEETSSPGKIMDNVLDNDVPKNAPHVEDQGAREICPLLREAALAEEDPVLKEKMWEEYRKYRCKPRS